MINKTKRSPLFYVGDKYKIIPEIKQYFPENIENFVEPFVGGGTVFLNIEAKKYLLNDIDENILHLHSFLMNKATCREIFFSQILQKIKKYNFSRSYIEDMVPVELKKKYKKTYYAKFNKTAYRKLRKEYNNSKKKDPLLLYLLLIYGFNRMIRFNSKGEFNVPVGNVDFNINTFKALNEYFDFVQTKTIKLFNLDFKDFINSLYINGSYFVYLDPPYLISHSEYNKIWDDKKEKDLLVLLNELDKKNIKFAISNIVKYKGKKNDIFIKWMKKYKLYKIKSNYISYHDNHNKKIEEVLVVNY